MAYTASDLSAIEAAIASGEQSVQFADRMVTFRSMDDLIKARNLIAASVAGRSKQTLVYANKGFGDAST